MVVLPGCGGVSPAGQPTDAAPTTTTATATPPTAPDPSLTTDGPSTVTDSSPSSPVSPTTESVSRGGLLVVEVVSADVQANESEAIPYDPTVFARSPTLDETVTDAVSANATQRRDLSAREVQRVETVASEYDASTGDLVVSKNGTVVRISLAYEL
jgi:hypothetical protein